jgi:DNA-binding LacI/PurR family transcriptional regulator
MYNINKMEKNMEKNIGILIKREIDIEEPVPLYIQIANIIRRKIENGELKVGDELAPEYELAEVLEVSIGTLKKALSILVKEGLIYRRPKLGTFVGKKIKEKIKKSFKNIMFILSNHRIPDHHYSVLFSGIEEGCRENLWNLQFYTYYDGDKFLEEILKKKKIDGAIIAGRIKKDLPLFLFKQHIHFVIIGDTVEKLRKIYYFPRIVIPIEKIIYKATEYLWEKGQRKIALISGDISFPYYLKMYQGYKKFVVKKGIEEIHYYKKGEIDRENEGYELTGKVLKGKVDAILCGNDLLAIGCIERLKKEGYKIPDDISVMGIGNLSISSLSSPSLTTIDFETMNLGKEAVKFLKEIIEGKRKRKSPWDRFKIIERESVKERDF